MTIKNTTKKNTTANNTILDFLNLTEEQLIHLDQAALNTDPNELWLAIRAALQSFATDSTPSTEEKYAFLQALANASPKCKMNLPEPFSPTHELDIEAIFNNLMTDDVLADIHVELIAAVKKALQQKRFLQELYTQGLKSKRENGPHSQYDIDELNATVDKAIRSKSNNAMFDIRVIGHLLAILLHLKFVAPLEDKNFPMGMKYVEPKEPDEYRKLASQMYNGAENGFPPAAKM